MDDIERFLAEGAARRAASRETDDKEHAMWHRLFGDDCRRPGCPKRKEGKAS